MSLNTSRPMSCYVTPPLEINYDFENDSSSPVSDAFSENDISITPPSSVGTNTPPTSPKTSKFGLFRKLSSKFSLKNKKSFDSPKSIEASPSSISNSDSNSLPSTPKSKRYSRDISNFTILPKTLDLKTPDTPKRTRSRSDKRYSVSGFLSPDTPYLPSPQIREDPEDLILEERSYQASKNITRLSHIPNSSVNINYSPESSYIIKNVKDQTLKLNIFFEELKPGNDSAQSVDEFDYFALKLRKDKLNNLNELVNVIVFKLLAKKQDLNINEVKLLIFFKDKTLNPIVLKQSMSELKSKSKQYQRPLNLNNDDLLLDYIKLKKKLYIMAQY